MKRKNKIFPVGIFLLIFVIGLVISITAPMAYLVYAGKSGAGEIEKYTRDYSITLAEAFAQVAELSYHKKKYPELKSLFREKARDNTIDEAFFVLNSGRIVIHSRPEVQKRLNNNIFADEMTYNSDMILKQARIKSRSILFTNYNIIGEEIPGFPFPLGTPRGHRNFIKNHIYKDVNTVGWLVSRAVFIKKKPVGTVNFIISKKRIYSFLIEQINTSMYLVFLSVTGSFFLSFFISLVIFIRYRRIQKYAADTVLENGVRSVDPTSIREVYDTVDESEVEAMTVEVIDEIGEEEENVIKTPEIREETSGAQPVTVEEQPRVKRIDTSRTIRDAIPVRKKG